MKNSGEKTDFVTKMTKFADCCRKADLRITPQRTAIYEMLIKSKEHPSANMVYEQIKKQFSNISFDTVNRTLHTFADIGVAEVVPTGGGAKRFDSTYEKHQHFLCVQCKNIIDFDFDGLDNITLPKDFRKKHTVLRKELYLEGICEKCRKKTTS
ncbi:MAG: transcriptional repressor [Sedimentisphaerales bacterium]|nr:transcriptional repressor [Sedimentisphaerales bacterium]